VTEAAAAAASGDREMVEGFAKGVKYALFFANVIIFVSRVYRVCMCIPSHVEIDILGSSSSALALLR